MNQARLVTLKDVATRAGVSLATVDRVLNNRGRSRRNTTERVHEAIRAIGYQPNVNAVRLTRGGQRRFPVFVNSSEAIFIQMVAAAVEAKKAAWARQGTAVELVRFNMADIPNLCAEMRRHGDGADGLAVMAPYHPTVIETVNDLATANVPVVTLVSDLPRSRRVGFAGIDNPSAGRTAGDLMGRFARGCDGTVIIVTPRLPIDDHLTRKAGFRQVFESDYAGCRVVECPVASDESDDAVEIVSTAIEAAPDLFGIYSTGGETRAIVNALNLANRPLRPVFIGHDLTPYSRRFLAEGTMDAVIGQSPEVEVETAINLLNAFCDGYAHEISGREIPIEIFMRHNLPATGSNSIKPDNLARS